LSSPRSWEVREDLQNIALQTKRVPKIQIQSVMITMLMNALDVMDSGGEIDIRAAIC